MSINSSYGNISIFMDNVMKGCRTEPCIKVDDEKLSLVDGRTALEETISVMIKTKEGLDNDREIVDNILERRLLETASISLDRQITELSEVKEIIDQNIHLRLDGCDRTCETKEELKSCYHRYLFDR